MSHIRSVVLTVMAGMVGHVESAQAETELRAGS